MGEFSDIQRRIVQERDREVLDHQLQSVKNTRKNEEWAKLASVSTYITSRLLDLRVPPHLHIEGKTQDGKNQDSGWKIDESTPMSYTGGMYETVAGYRLRGILLSVTGRLYSYNGITDLDKTHLNTVTAYGSYKLEVGQTNFFEPGTTIKTGLAVLALNHNITLDQF